MTAAYRTSINGNQISVLTGDQLYLLTDINGDTGQPTVTDDQSGGTWSPVPGGAALFGGSTCKLWAFVRDHQVTGNATMTLTTTFAGTPNNSMQYIVAVSGMTLTGTASIRSVGVQANQALGGTPAPALNQACLTSNVTIGVIGNQRNGAGMTNPTGWTQRYDDGTQNVGDTFETGLHVDTRDSGFTGTTVTWGSTSLQPFASLIFEIDGGTGVPTISPTGIASLQAIGSATLGNVLKSSKTGAAITIAASDIYAEDTADGVAGSWWDPVTFFQVDEFSGTPTISPTGIATAQAFGAASLSLRAVVPTGVPTAYASGSAQLNLKFSPTAIASSQAFGTTSLNKTINGLTGIATAYASGSASLSLRRIVPTGIVTAEALGSDQLNKIINGLTGIATAQAFGSDTVSTTVSGQTVSPTGVGTGYASGTQSLIVYVKPTGVGTGYASGSASISLRRIGPTGIATAEALGSDKLNKIINGLTGVPTAYASGSAALQPGPVTITCTGIATAYASGAARMFLYAKPTGIVTGYASGSAAVSLRRIGPAGLVSAEAFGTTNFILFAKPTGIATAYASGTEQIKNVQAILPSGLATAYASGTAALHPGPVTVTATAIASAEAFGAARLRLYALVTGIASSQALGGVTLRPVISPSGFTTAYASGTARASLRALPTGVASSEAFGTTRVLVYVKPAGLASAEAIGALRVQRPPQSMSCTGIASSYVAGATTLQVGVAHVSPAAIASAEQLGALSVSRGVLIGPIGIATSSVFGATKVASWRNPFVYTVEALVPGPVDASSVVE